MPGSQFVEPFRHGKALHCMFGGDRLARVLSRLKDEELVKSYGQIWSVYFVADNRQVINS